MAVPRFDTAKEIESKVVNAISVLNLKDQSEILGWFVPLLERDLAEVESKIRLEGK